VTFAARHPDATAALSIAAVLIGLPMVVILSGIYIGLFGTVVSWAARLI
jgi:hypothetical protein